MGSLLHQSLKLRLTLKRESVLYRHDSLPLRNRHPRGCQSQR